MVTACQHITDLSHRPVELLNHRRLLGLLRRYPQIGILLELCLGQYPVDLHDTVVDILHFRINLALNQEDTLGYFNIQLVLEFLHQSRQPLLFNLLEMSEVQGNIIRFKGIIPFRGNTGPALITHKTGKNSGNGIAYGT